MNPFELWKEQARYDLETAEAMFASQRYLYVVFCCQQAIEKYLKALIVKKTHEFPPRTHNLPKLAQLVDSRIIDQEENFLILLSTYYIETRYPDKSGAQDQSISQKTAKKILHKTKEVVRWLLLVSE